MKTFKHYPIKDKDGRINIDINELTNVDNPEEKYPAGRNQWRIGEMVQEEEIIFDENKVAYSKKLIYL